MARRALAVAAAIVLVFIVILVAVAPWGAAVVLAPPARPGSCSYTLQARAGTIPGTLAAFNVTITSTRTAPTTEGMNLAVISSSGDLASAGIGQMIGSDNCRNDLIVPADTGNLYAGIDPRFHSGWIASLFNPQGLLVASFGQACSSSSCWLAYNGYVLPITLTAGDIITILMNGVSIDGDQLQLTSGSGAVLGSCTL